MNEAPTEVDPNAPSGGSTLQDLRALTIPIIATAVAGVGMTVWGASRSGSPGLLAAALGAVVVLAFFLGGQLILARILRTNPMISMGAAMGVYLAQILILLVLLVALKDASFFDARVFGLTVVVCVLTWTLSALTSMKGMRDALAPVPPPTDDPSENASQAGSQTTPQTTPQTRSGATAQDDDSAST